MILSEHAQGTDGWRLDRCGKATGSHAAEILSKGKSGESVGRRNYRFQLACERLTGKVQESGYTNKHMERGNEQEPFARMAYEAATGNMVHEAGFAYLGSLPAGCSVDGFIDDDGIAEFKCPIPAVHFGYLHAGKVPTDYDAQITHNLYITGRAFCDFASYCEDMPEKLRLFMIRVVRDEEAIKAYEKELLLFLADVAALELDMRERAK